MPRDTHANFADTLIQRVRELRHPLCVGLDPHLGRIPPVFRRGSMSPRDPDTPVIVEEFCRAVIDRLDGMVAVIKPQIAFFEEMGWQGLRVLDRLVDRARKRGLLVLLDAKRGDIGSTAAGYARAYLGPEAGIPVDALTVNPYLGTDTLEPFVEACRDHGRGLFVLVKTSNPGSGDFQDLEVEGRSIFERVAVALADIEADLAGPATGWSSLGVVVGATYPGQAERVRETLPRSLFLIPGYGAQGASAKEAVRSFVPGESGLEGGIVNSSRAILFPRDGETDDAATWEQAFDAALDAAVDELGNAVSS